METTVIEIFVILLGLIIFGCIWAKLTMPH